ncbi:tol-pal system YbgF family protein [Verrucomicrobiota bacterium]
MKEILTFSLAAVLSLFADFNDGMECFKDRKYDEAIVKFTKVIKAETDIQDVRELSLFYRAQSYAGAKKKDEALKDLSVLIKDSDNDTLKKEAVKLYVEYGGKLKELLPKDGPKEITNKILLAAQTGDEKKVKAYLSGPLLNLLNTVDIVFKVEEGESLLAEIGPELGGGVSFISETIDSTNRTATVTARIENSVFTLGLKLSNGKWVFDSVLGYVNERRHHRRNNNVGSEMQDINKLRQLDAAIEQYTMANRRVPAKLSDAGDYVKDFANASISSVDGKPFVFVMPKNSEQPWVFTATAKDGKRQGLVNGTVRTIAEAEFKALAKAHGIKIPGEWKKVKITDKETKKIQALINQLGAKAFKDRREAYEALKAMGGKAGGLLEKAVKNPDPEIAAQAKKLLSEL